MNKNVKSIPEGYRTITPFIFVKNAAQAIDFYKKAFSATEIERHAAPDGKIMHALLKFGDSLLMLADEMPDKGCGISSPSTLKGSTMMLHLYVNDVDSSFNKAQQAGCKVKMPVMDTFWGDRYGQVEDPFGHLWSIATHKVDLSQEEIAKKGQEFMSKKCCQ